jgi:hypothetical protein
MRLAWTAIVPRSLVDDLDEHALAPSERYVLVIAPHVDPALRIVRCYHAGASPALVAARPPSADHVPAA